MALAVWHLPGRDGEVAGRLEARPRRLARHVEADRRREVGGAGRGLDVRGEPDAEMAARSERARLLGAERREVGQLDGARERLECRHADQRRAGQHARGLVGLADQVAEAELLGRQTEFARDLVEHPVADPGLGDPRAAVRDVARLVGGDDRRLERVRLELVRGREQRPHE